MSSAVFYKFNLILRLNLFLEICNFLYLPLVSVEKLSKVNEDNAEHLSDYRCLRNNV
jgi:hypothetical protein